MANAMPPGAEKVPLNCTTPADDWLGNAQNNFDMGSWLSRGLCVRRGLSYWSPVSTYECYARLENVLINNINGIRTAEYGGAAGVLALLPTIGALLGTPTNEIWHLLNMIPFGGFIAMACSFGGAILPVKPKDYESGFMKKYMKNTLHFRARTNSNLALPTTLDPHEQDRIKRRADILLEKVARKLQDERRRKVPKMYILYGLTGMLLLLCVAQAAMVLIEFGAVLPWWCQSKWWVHLWYLMVLVSTSIDNWVQLPFDKQWTLLLSDVPYDLTVVGGDLITDSVEGKDHEIEGIKKSLGQLRSIKPGSVRFDAYPQHSTQARNALFVVVSVAEQSHDWQKTFVRSFSKITSIAVYVVGTACFASAQLLSISMATFVLACILGAGVFGRAITSWIVTGIETADPMVHFVADSDDEAYHMLARLFMIGRVGMSDNMTRQIQIEINGQVFLDRRRVASRSSWIPRLMGILTSPYNLARAVYKEKTDNGMYDLENMKGPDDQAGVRSPLVKPALLPRETWGSGSSSVIETRLSDV